MQQFKYNPNNHRGLYRHKIFFFSKAIVQDELGQETEGEWETVADAWAMIKTLQGREYFAAGAERDASKSRFIIPYRPGITADMRIMYNGRLFDIIEPPINDDEMNRTLTIIVNEVREDD